MEFFDIKIAWAAEYLTDKELNVDFDGILVIGALFLISWSLRGLKNELAKGTIAVVRLDKTIEENTDATIDIERTFRKNTEAVTDVEKAIRKSGDSIVEGTKFHADRIIEVSRHEKT